jgi:peptidoglycan/LPS O-acetylase OafA/YrhL
MYVLHSFPYHITVESIRGLSVSGRLGAAALLVKWLYLPALAAVAFGGAWISWNVLEEPFLRLKRKFPYLAAPSIAAGSEASTFSVPLHSPAIDCN